MRLFLLFLMGFLSFSFPVKADDQNEIAMASVRIFHDVCMGSVTNPERVAQLLSNFKQLPENEAVAFRKNLEAGPESKVWGFNFTKANFVAVIDPSAGSCQFVGDKQLRFADVEAEFKQAMKGFAQIKGIQITPIKKNISDMMGSLQYEYRIPDNDMSFKVFASVKNGEVKQGAMGLIYTMRVEKISS